MVSRCSLGSPAFFGWFAAAVVQSTPPASDLALPTVSVRSAPTPSPPHYQRRCLAETQSPFYGCSRAAQYSASHVAISSTVTLSGARRGSNFPGNRFCTARKTSPAHSPNFQGRSETPLRCSQSVHALLVPGCLIYALVKGSRQESRYLGVETS